LFRQEKTTKKASMPSACTPAGVLPLRDKDYHYRYRLETGDVLIELLRQGPPISAWWSLYQQPRQRRVALERRSKRALSRLAQRAPADWLGCEDGPGPVCFAAQRRRAAPPGACRLITS